MNDIRTAPRAWAEIDLNALVNNYRTLQKAAGGAKMMCVIKGDAHGHGAVECARLRQTGRPCNDLVGCAARLAEELVK